MAAPAHAAHWHDAECGGYAADLALWTELAREAAGPVLELGCGTGRVALHLAAAGIEVTALDSSAELLDALANRATKRGLGVETVHADARAFTLGRQFALICAPMQLVQVLGGSGPRSWMLRSVAARLSPGGKVGFAILSGTTMSRTHAPPPLPDVIERDGWVYSSQPVEVVAVDGVIELRRLRQLVSPAGELDSELDVVRLDALDPDQLAREARDAGLVEVERHAIAATNDHQGSIVSVLEAG